MISIIICSRRPDISRSLRTNIMATIQCDYELVIIDNSKNNFSIFSAYEKGVKMANGTILCFMHEDIIIHTYGWGLKVEDYFIKYKNVGLIGVAGTHFIPKTPAAWWDSELRSGHFIQGTTQGKNYKKLWNSLWDEYRAEPTQVAAVDGLWMCIPRKMFNMISWDTKSFTGFHNYDIDISLQIWNSKYEVHIFWDIVIEHQSLGLTNNTYNSALVNLFNKWNDYFPFIKGVSLSNEEICLYTRIAELNYELRTKNNILKEIYTSRAYKLSLRIRKAYLCLSSIMNK